LGRDNWKPLIRFKRMYTHAREYIYIYVSHEERMFCKLFDIFIVFVGKLRSQRFSRIVAPVYRVVFISGEIFSSPKERVSVREFRRVDFWTAANTCAEQHAFKVDGPYGVTNISMLKNHPLGDASSTIYGYAHRSCQQISLGDSYS